MRRLASQCDTVELGAGDVLYLPAGTLHNSSAQDVKQVSFQIVHEISYSAKGLKDRSEIKNEPCHYLLGAPTVPFPSPALLEGRRSGNRGGRYYAERLQRVA